MSESSRYRPILRLVVSPVKASDDTHLEAVLGQIASQNSVVSIKGQEGSYSLEGMTEPELDSVCDRLRDEFHLAINVGAPSAILLETIRKQAEGEGKYIRQTGGSGNYGHCKLRVEPNEPGKGYEFINDIKTDVLPEKYIKPIDQGVQGAMRFGILAGFQMVDIKVTLFDGSYHEVDSNEMAFAFAGSIAFKETGKKASPVVLEPMMALEIMVPEELAPATRHEVYTHRGRIENSETASGFIEIRAVILCRNSSAPPRESLHARWSLRDTKPFEMTVSQTITDQARQRTNLPAQGLENDLRQLDRNHHKTNDRSCRHALLHKNGKNGVRLASPCP